RPPIEPTKDKNEAARPLERPRFANSEQLPHQQPQIVGRYLYQVPLGHLFQSPQPSPSPTPCLTNMGEAAFHILTSQSLQPLAPVALHPSPVGLGRFPPGLRFVFPVSLLPLRLGNVGPSFQIL